MLDTVTGLPVHALVIHAVVVLLPLAVLGTIAIALRPAWRARFGPLVVAVAVVATALCPVATSSGEALAARVGDPGEHAALGDALVWFAIPMTLLALALVVLDRRARSARGAGREARPGGAVVMAVAVFAVVASIAAGVQVVRVGHSGSEAVWAGIVEATNGTAASGS